MTTLVENAMTLSNARFSNDDQQVPDTNGVVVPVGQQKSAKPRLPDFSSLLLEPQNSAAVLNTPDLIQSLDFGGYPEQLDAATGDAFLTWGEEESIYAAGGDVGDEIAEQKALKTMTTTFSDAMSESAPMLHLSTQEQNLAALEPVRPTSLALAPSQVLPPLGAHYAHSPASSSASSACSPIAPTEPFGNLEQAGMEDFNALCQRHLIPRDPISWNTAHVQKWVALVRERYNLPETDQYLLGIEGPTLCKFTESDFCRQTSDSVGSYFHADLDWWKAACGSPMECNPPMSYTDLTALTPTSTVSSSNPNMYSTASLTSPVMQNSPMMTQPTTTSSSSQEIPTPVFVDLDLTKSSLYQINNEVEQHQQQQQQQQFSYLSSLWEAENSVGGAIGGSSTQASSCDSSLNSVESFHAALNPNPNPNTTPPPMPFNVSSIKQEAMDDDASDFEDDEDSRGFGAAEKRRYVSHSKHTIHLWQFLKNLLQSPERYGSYIKWLDHNKGIFKIENSREVAKLWGQRKNRPAMNYDKLSRSIRQYYKKGIIKKTTHSKRLVYQFQPTYL